MAVFFRIKLVDGLIAINFKFAYFNKTIYLSKERDGLKIIVGAKKFKIYKRIGSSKKFESINLPKTDSLFTIIKDSIRGEISFLGYNVFLNLNDCRSKRTIIYFVLFKNNAISFLKKMARKQQFSTPGTKFECNLNFTLNAHLLSIISATLKILFARRKTNGSKL